MMLWIYSVVIGVYDAIIRSLAPFYARANAIAVGRLTPWPKLPSKINKRIWIHAASLGEFEQGRPVIEALRAIDIDLDITLTFFSPSGYEIRNNYPVVNRVLYMPLDTRSRAKDFLDYLEPNLVIFIKYDFWINHMSECVKRQIPLVFISSVFRFEQVYFRALKSLYLPVFRKVDQFFVQDHESQKVLHRNAITAVTVSGDSRIDNVLLRSKAVKQNPDIEAFLDGCPIMILGSLWEDDLNMLKPIIAELQKSYQLIVVPHDVSESNIRKTEGYFNDTVRYSDIKVNRSSRHLIIDQIGMLATLYQLATLVYVGGGRHGALHNILEPAAFGKPIFVADHPKNRKFIEVEGLAQVGAVFPIRDAKELITCVKKLKQQVQYQQASEAALAYLQQHSGATEKIMNYLKEKLV